MQHTPLLARLGLWRVTRHDTTRSLYDRVESAGFAFAQLDRFERDTSAAPRGVDVAGIDDVVAEPVCEVDDLPARLDGAPLAPSDRIVAAVRDGDRIGYCCLSHRPVYVPELHRRIDFSAAYLWRLYVEPDHRGQGVGTVLVARTVDAARTECEAGRIVALVAPDNLPSRKAFRRVGFEPTERFTTVGGLGREIHRRADLRSGP